MAGKPKRTRQDERAKAVSAKWNDERAVSKRAKSSGFNENGEFYGYLGKDDEGYRFNQIPREFDAVLPFLDTAGEVKLMYVILRQTINWGKPYDYLAYSQLSQFAGLADQTIADAIESLKVKGLIEVQEAGIALKFSPKMRNNSVL